MLTITPIPAFQDNYIWLLQRGTHAVVVDPGDAAPVIAKLKAESLQLDAILITHHHADHIGGVAELATLAKERPDFGPAIVYAPKKGRYQFEHIAVAEHDMVNLDTIGLMLSVMEVPGHTLDHIAYYGANYLFCGDTLFSAGCGRLFEGTATQMYASLQRFAELPAATEVYCTHEYTEHNLRFAMTLDPNNTALAARVQQVKQLRQADKPSLPSTMQIELATNPFLRCGTEAINRSSGITTNSPVEVFAAIRDKRNHF